MTADQVPGVPGVVVVTGISRFLAARVAARLAADPGVERVIGLDAADPSRELAGVDGVEHVRADARAAGSAVADLGAEAVVHLAVTTSPDKHNGGRAAMKE